MKRVRKHKTIGFMLVVMMTILALLPLVSLAMEQNSSEELVELNEVQYEKVENQRDLEVLPQGVKIGKEEVEKVLYACIAVACPGLILLGTVLYKKREVENINYW